MPSRRHPTKRVPVTGITARQIGSAAGVAASWRRGGRPSRAAPRRLAAPDGSDAQPGRATAARRAGVAITHCQPASAASIAGRANGMRFIGAGTVSERTGPVTEGSNRRRCGPLAGRAGRPRCRATAARPGSSAAPRRRENGRSGEGPRPARRPGRRRVGASSGIAGRPFPPEIAAFDRGIGPPPGGMGAATPFPPLSRLWHNVQAAIG